MTLAVAENIVEIVGHTPMLRLARDNAVYCAVSNIRISDATACAATEVLQNLTALIGGDYHARFWSAPADGESRPGSLAKPLSGI